MVGITGSIFTADARMCVLGSIDRLGRPPLLRLQTG